jgi:hypothetical protein
MTSDRFAVFPDLTSRAVRDSPVQFQLAWDHRFSEITLADKIRHHENVADRFRIEDRQCIAQTRFFFPKRAFHYRENISPPNLSCMRQGRRTRIGIHRRAVSDDQEPSAFIATHSGKRPMFNPPSQGFRLRSYGGQVGAAGVQRSISLDDKSFEMKSVIMRLRPGSFVVLIIAVAIVGCAQPQKPVTVKKAAVQVGSRFNGVGTVTLHTGQPCASQIMFDFRRGRSTSAVWLAANAKDEKSLNQAASCDCRVQVTGTWRRGRSPNCNYVSVTSVVRDQYR